MSLPSVAELVRRVQQLPLLDRDQNAELGSWQAQFTGPRSLSKALLERGWLTPFQVNQLMQDGGQPLLLGPYLLLERLGQGGMGQVFKARHLVMKRLVALKVIREERLDSADAVQRFLREIQATAQLAHANIVMAHDAGQADSQHFLVMEYVEGQDLTRLVQRGGPLPVGRACAYIGQAAQGLQHAHERGLIHRDIKPSNLLLAPGDVIKVLDLGLARVLARADGQAAGRVTPYRQRSLPRPTPGGPCARCCCPDWGSLGCCSCWS